MQIETRAVAALAPDPRNTRTHSEAQVAQVAAGRHALAIELHAPYVDVSVERWQNFTGKEATLEGDGRTFAEIRDARALIAAE